MTIPAFGLGTFRLQGQVAFDAVTNALAAGYRAVDTAQIYGNEAEVGRAIAASGVDRSALFITTKIWVDNFAPDQFIPSLRDSLTKLQTDAVDLTLIHWPSPGNAVPVEVFMGELKQAQDLGLTRQIGVSNFNVALMKQAIAAVGDGVIATNQVELHPFLQNRTVAAFAAQHDIHVTSYMTLGVGKVLENTVIQAIAAAHGATPAQVALAWAMQLGYSVIPSSTKPDHLASNLKACDLTLSADDMAAIAALDCGGRITDPKALAPDWD